MKFFFKKIWWFNLLKQIHFNLHLNRWKTVARLGFCCWWVVRFYLAFQLWKSNRIAERTESNRWVLELLRSCAWSTILMCLRLSTSTGHRGMLVCDNGQWSTTSPRAFSYQIMVHNGFILSWRWPTISVHVHSRVWWLCGDCLCVVPDWSR